MEPAITAALVAFFTSVITLIIGSLLKSYLEKRFHIFKLKTEHEYEQRKQIKDILARNKIHLLNSCESLDHRLWNFSIHCKDGWHNNESYYFYSFIYRFICVFSWIKKTENEMVYLDTTIALKEDMVFIKYLRLFPQLMCDTTLFAGCKYDENNETDHFFRNNFDRMAECLMSDNGVISYSAFENNLGKYRSELSTLCEFIIGISPEEDRLRWDRLQVFHLALMSFLNAFGYDFQITPPEKVRDLLSRNRPNKLIANYISLLEKVKLADRNEIKDIIKATTE